MDQRIQDFLESELKETDEHPDFSPGDTIRVHTREEIGGQMRNRTFEGICISRGGNGPNQTFKVRKTSFGVGIERIFPLYSELVQDIEVARKGKVRRAKLNYLEGRSQKESRIKEQRYDEGGEKTSETKPDSEQSEEGPDEARDDNSEDSERSEDVQSEQERSEDDNVEEPTSDESETGDSEEEEKPETSSDEDDSSESGEEKTDAEQPVSAEESTESLDSKEEVRESV